MLEFVRTGAFLHATGTPVLLKVQITECGRDGLSGTFIILLSPQLPSSSHKSDPDHIIERERVLEGLSNVGGDGRTRQPSQVKRFALCRECACVCACVCVQTARKDTRSQQTEEEDVRKGRVSSGHRS